MGQKVRLGKVVLTLGGDWTEGESYSELTYVTHNGDGWISLVPNIDTEPGSDDTKWRKATDVQRYVEAMQAATRAAERLNEQIGQAEQDRARAEDQRAQAEQARAQAEGLRADAESGRGNAELARAQAERLRAQAEQLRVQAEQQREQAEAQRREAVDTAVRLTNNAVRANQEATQRANGAASNADAKAGEAATAAQNARDAAASVDQKVMEAYTLPEFSIDEETMELQAEDVPLTDQFELEDGNLTVDF